MDIKKQLKIKNDIAKIFNPVEEYQLKRQAVLNIAKEYIITAFGAFIMAMGISLFLLPNELSTGGFSGIGTILYYLFGTPLGVTTFVLNIPFLIIVFLKIGKELFFKSIFGTAMLSISIDLIDRLNPITQDKFLACIYGGILMGVGTAIILKMNASTGGSDLLSYIIRTYKPEYRSGNLIWIIDTIVIILNVIFLKRIEIGLYSAIATYLSSKTINVFSETLEKISKK